MDPLAPQCDCLSRALDQPDQPGDDGKRRVLAIAKAFHRRTKVEPPPPTPVRQDVPAEPQQAIGHAEDALPPPAPETKPEPPVRVVHRTCKWFDNDRPRFERMKF